MNIQLPADMLDQSEAETSLFEGLSLKSIRCFLAVYESYLKPFEGFMSPDRGGTYFLMPVAFIDLLPRLKGAMHEVAVYFFRHNWGFHEYRRKLRITQEELMNGRMDASGSRMDQGTGLSERAIRAALKALVKMGVLVCETIRGRFGPEQTYGIHIQGEEGQDEQGNEEHRQKMPPLIPPAKNAGPPAKNAGPPAKNAGPPAKNAATIVERNLERNKDKSQGKRESAPTRTHSLFPLLEKRMNYEILRTAPWGIETLLNLSSKVLPVPDEETIRAGGDQEAIERWYADWYKPAERLYHATVSLDPVLAWRRIDNLIRYMVTAGSPSWWQQGRTEQTPTMLRHVANHYNDYSADMKRHHWSPQEITAYDGPLPYAAGYSGTPPRTSVIAVEETLPPAEVDEQMEIPESSESSTAVVPTPPESGLSRFAQWRASRRSSQVVDAQPVLVQPAAVAVAPPIDVPLPAPYAAVQLRGMSREEVNAQAERIARSYPGISMKAQQLEDGSYVLGIEHREGDFFPIRRAVDLTTPPPVLERIIGNAIALGQSRAEMREGA